MKLKIFERKHEKLASMSVFRWRVAASFGLATLLVFIVLLVGVAGYHWLAGFDLVQSILEASMILGGMGPVEKLPNSAAKIFASCYALFSGLVFIALMGIVLAPIAHRMLHKFHLDKNASED